MRRSCIFSFALFLLLGTVPMVSAQAWDPNADKPVLGTPPQADSALEISGPTIAVLDTGLEVWDVENQWEETDTKTARAAGMAWDKESGLDWSEKYRRWIRSLERIQSHNGRYTTFLLTTPWGKTLPAPALVGTELALMLRVTFAAWYRLPLYLEAADSDEQSIYLGHFGFRNATGERMSGSPNFAHDYVDHTPEFDGASDDEIVAHWPQDKELRSQVLTDRQDDLQPSLGEDAYAGAYLDEIFLNKRVGHFMIRLLTNSGSMHVCHHKNTFNLKASAVREGDVLVERWNSSGIGHTLVVKRVERLDGDQIDAELVYGSMPRIQPQWYDASLSKSYFISDYTGGEGTNSDGEKLVQFGGGLKRWRIARPCGRLQWCQVVPKVDLESYIASTDYDELARRPKDFDRLLGRPTPEESRDHLLQQLAHVRARLRSQPASCPARSHREDLFGRLYRLMTDHFEMSRQETDEHYRELDDYVLPELSYNQSMLCRFKGSTVAMYTMILAYNQKRVYDESTGTFSEPLVYTEHHTAAYWEFAQSIGRAEDWVAWSEDETCPEGTCQTDVETEHHWTPYLDIAKMIWHHEPGDLPEQGCGNVTWDGYCDGNTVVWCQDDQIETYDCVAGTTCQWWEEGEYYWCQ